MGKKKGGLKKVVSFAKKTVQVAQKAAKNPVVRAGAKALVQALPKKQQNWVNSGLAVATRANSTIQRSLPAIQGAISMVKNDQTTTERFEWDLISGYSGAVPSNGTLLVEMPVAPYDGAALIVTGGGSIQYEWDKTLQAFYPRFTHYRVKSITATYTGTAPTTATGTVYMASAEEPITEAPAFTEFTMMERNIKGPVFEPGFSLAGSHDTNWHPIDATRTWSGTNSTTTDRKVHWAGVLFLALTELNIATVRFRIAVTFEFKGRNPAYSSAITSMLFAGTGTGNTIANEYANTLAISQGNPIPRWGNANSATYANYNLDAGYHFINIMGTAYSAGAGAASNANNIFDIYNAGSSVRANRVLLMSNLGTIIPSQTSEVQKGNGTSLSTVFAAETLYLAATWALVKSSP